jgi:hypothetical protein
MAQNIELLEQVQIFVEKNSSQIWDSVANLLALARGSILSAPMSPGIAYSCAVAGDMWLQDSFIDLVLHQIASAIGDADVHVTTCHTTQFRTHPRFKPVRSYKHVLLIPWLSDGHWKLLLRFHEEWMVLDSLNKPIQPDEFQPYTSEARLLTSRTQTDSYNCGVFMLSHLIYIFYNATYNPVHQISPVNIRLLLLNISLRCELSECLRIFQEQYKRDETQQPMYAESQRLSMSNTVPLCLDDEWEPPVPAMVQACQVRENIRHEIPFSEASFVTFEEAEQAVAQACIAEGFLWALRSTSPYQRTRAIYECSGRRSQNVSRQGEKCSWELHILSDKGTYRINVVDGIHNHKAPNIVCDKVILPIAKLPVSWGVRDYVQHHPHISDRKVLAKEILQHLHKFLPANKEYLIPLENLRYLQRATRGTLHTTKKSWQQALEALRDKVTNIRTYIRYNEDNNIDAFMWLSPVHYYNYIHYNDCIQLDDTYNVCSEEAILLEGTCRTSNGVLVTCFQCLHWRKTAQVYQFIFQVLNDLSMKLPRVIICDEDEAIMGAINNIFTTTQVQNCYFHVQRNIIRHYKGTIPKKRVTSDMHDDSDDDDDNQAGVRPFAVCDEEVSSEELKFKQDLNAVAYSRSTDKADKLMRQLIQTYGNNKKFKDYLESRRCNMTYWSLCHRMHTFNFDAMTTADVENVHAAFKRYLRETTSRALKQFKLSSFIDNLPTVFQKMEMQEADQIIRLQKKTQRRRTEDIDTLMQTYEDIQDECEERITLYAWGDMSSSMLRGQVYSCSEVNAAEILGFEAQMLEALLPSDRNYKFTVDIGDNVYAAMQSQNSVTFKIYERGHRSEYVTYNKSTHRLMCSCSKPILTGLLCEHYFAAFKMGVVPFHLKLINARYVQPYPAETHQFYRGLYGQAVDELTSCYISSDRALKIMRIQFTRKKI